MQGTPQVRESRGGRLAQAVRAAMPKPSLPAPFPEGVAETVPGVGRATLRNEKGQVTALCHRNDALQFIHNRQSEFHRVALAVFRLREAQYAIAHHLPPE